MQVPKFYSEGSPLARFVFTLEQMNENRALFGTLGNAFGAGPFRLFSDDLNMLLTERLVIGLRTQWLRRVAVPMLMAQRALAEGEGDMRARATIATEILTQLAGYDNDLMARCVSWLHSTFIEPKPANDSGESHVDQVQKLV